MERVRALADCAGVPAWFYLKWEILDAVAAGLERICEWQGISVSAFLSLPREKRLAMGEHFRHVHVRTHLQVPHHN
jgi:hypothetical protein